MTENTPEQPDLEFLTGLRYSDDEYVGIVVNANKQYITFYDVGSLPSELAKRHLLDLAETWWWQSNRQIPIDVFLYTDMKPFRPYLKTFTQKETTVLFGPVTSLQNFFHKRIKKRTVQLIKKVD